MTEYKLILSIIATVIAVVGYIPYIRDIRSGKTKPHGFSWLVWSLLGFIAGAAQVQGGGGAGAAVTLVTSVICLWIAFISLKKGQVKITVSDWISLVAALITIPIWLITKQPLLSVVLVSAIDIFGFWPTIRKSYRAPQHETLSTHILSTIKHCLSVAAQQHYSLLTVLYPASLAVTTALFTIMLVVHKPKKIRSRK